MPNDSERALAIFVDFDNIAQGFRRTDRFDIQRVLKRMVEKGKIVAKKTYADWSRYIPYTSSLHEAAFELVEIPKRSMTGKNSADIRLCVDAMDLAYNKPHIDTFVIVSGDSDFTPLVSKLKEMGKHVIGLGMTNSTSDLLRDNCDEFIYYEDLEVEKTESPKVTLPGPDTKRKALELLLEACTALRRENKEVLWASMIKETMKRKKPSFNETYHGFNTFSALLEDAQSQGLVELERDSKRGTYSVMRFGEELTGVIKKEPTREREPSRTRGREPVASQPRTPPVQMPIRNAPPKRATPATPKYERNQPAERFTPAPERFAPQPERYAPPPERFTPPPERVVPATSRPIEEDIKPRETRFQGFSDFAEETTQFLGQRKPVSFEEDFPDFTPPARATMSSTADEVRANIAETRKAPMHAPVPPQVPAYLPPPLQTAPVEEHLSDDSEQMKRQRRRRGNRKDRVEDEVAASNIGPGKAAERPISFEDVPFMNSAPAEEMPAVTEPRPAPPARTPVRQFTPDTAPPPVQKPAPVSPPEEPRGFGFGVFDV